MAESTEQSPSVYFHYLPHLQEGTYSQLGDINIGDIANTADYSHLDVLCKNSLSLSSLVSESTEPVKFAVDLVNRDPDLLPNVTLGFIIRGGCPTVGIKLTTSLSFLPRSERVCNGTTCYTRASTSSDSPWLSHDVIGLMAPEASDEALPVSTLFSAAHLPVVGYSAGSDQLGGKGSHPYFFRISPQDYFLVRAILKFISHNGWDYIQMIYRDVDYGRDAARNMYKFAPEYGICIAASFSMSTYGSRLKNILKTPRARVVVSFIATWRLRSLLQEVVDRDGAGQFIWIGSDVLDGYYGYSYSGVSHDPGIGAFIFYPTTAFIPAYYDHIRKLDVLTTKNPWLKPIWEEFLSCSYGLGTCDTDADILKTRGYRPFKSALLRIDAVLTFAHAAHNLLQDKCPDARGKEARVCITGERLLEYLEKLKFQGYNGFVEFDENHNMRSNFTIRQLVYGYHEDEFGTNKEKRIFENTVAIYDTVTGNIEFLNETISWSYLKTVERIVPWTNGSLPIDIPESVCSRPCVAGEYKIEKDVPCCWDCVKCRDNERVADGNTRCEACPSFMWPDPTSDFTNCIDIPPSYQTMEDTIPIILVSITVVSLVITVIIFVLYVIYRDERVIKASSRELSIIQLIAIFVGYSTVILFQTTPTDAMCQSIFFQFCMSFSMLYSPLLVKTIRIFRIFRSGVKNERPTFISPQSQLIFSIVLMAIQFLLCGATFLFYNPGAQRTQPVWGEKWVELSCDFTFPGLASFLGYNVVVIFLCAVVAFMVRALPDNFNESKFISICVSTTLLIWLAFIPTYYTANREYVRGILISMSLLLNHSVALVLLFATKIYKVIFSPSDAGDFSNARS